jgi:hypothetical protein
MFCSILNCIAPLEARHELSHIHLSPGPAVVSVLHSLNPPSLTQHRLGLSDSDHRLSDLAACVVQTLFEIGEMGLAVTRVVSCSRPCPVQPSQPAPSKPPPSHCRTHQPDPLDGLPRNLKTIGGADMFQVANRLDCFKKIDEPEGKLVSVLHWR